MKKIFIYYSLTGNGDLVANYLKEKNIIIRKVNAIDKMPKNKIFRILTGGFLAGINYKAKLIDFDNNIDEYDEIIIGSPIWNGKLSCPINSVLEKLNLDNKKIKFILYSGSGKSEKIISKLENIYHDLTIINLQEPIKYKDELNKLNEL